MGESQIVSGFYAMDFGFQVLDSGFVVIGTCIPDSNAQDSRFLQVQICSDYGFHKQNFHGFPIPLQGAKRERLSKPVLHSEPLDISRTATPTAKVASIWTSSICQMQATFPGAEFLRILFRFKKRKENIVFVSSRPP